MTNCPHKDHTTSCLHICRDLYLYMLLSCPLISCSLSLSPSQSPEEGAVSSIYCAVAEETEGITGKYFDSDCSIVLPAPPARDAALAVKDFEICERVTSKL